MKRLLISCQTLFLTTSCYCQLQKIDLPEMIKIGEAKIVGSFVASLNFIHSNNDTTYYLKFNNAKYSTLTDIQSISFNHTPGILDSLYKTFSTALDMKEGKTISILLGKEMISVKEERSMGMKFITIMKTDGAFFSLRRKQLESLFNRK